MRQSNRKNFWHIFLRVIGLFVVIFLAFQLADLAGENESVRTIVRNYGLVGIFMVSVLSGFNFVVPIPAVAFLPLFVASGLSFWPAIFVIALGVSLADSIAFLIGRVGRQIFHNPFEKKVFSKLEEIQKHYGVSPMGILFLFASLAPLPNEILLIPIGFLGYRFIKILPVLLAGNVAFNILYAYGVLSLFRIF